MVVVVAAGNDDVDACTQSPSGASKVISVAAIDGKDTRADFSNFGKCVKMFAPVSKEWFCAINLIHQKY